jgi:cell division protein FtsL
MASWHEAAAVAAPRSQRAHRPRTKTAPKRRSRRKARTGVAGGLVWIVIAGVLLAGIVALNVAVLRLNVQVDRLNNESAQLRADNAALGAKLSAAASSTRIQALAKARGFIPADPTTIGFVDLTPRRSR